MLHQAPGSPKWSKKGNVFDIASTNCCVETLPEVSISEKALTRSGRGDCCAAICVSSQRSFKYLQASCLVAAAKATLRIASTQLLSSLLSASSADRSSLQVHSFLQTRQQVNNRRRSRSVKLPPKKKCEALEATLVALGPAAGQARPAMRLRYPCWTKSGT